jgi:hypothetical protein
LAAWLLGEVALRPDRPVRAKLSAAGYLTLALAVTQWATKLLFINGAPEPSQSSGGILPPNLGWSFVLVAPFSSATGFGSLFSHSLFAAGKNAAEGWALAVPAMIAAAPLLVGLYAWTCLRQHNRRFGRLAAWMVATYCLALGVLLYRHATVSLEDRHFRLAGILLLIGWVVAGLEAPASPAPAARWGQMTLLGLAAISAIYGASTAVRRIHALARFDHIASCGLTLPNLNHAADEELCRIDRQGAEERQILFLADPTLSAEVRHSRLIATDLAIQDDRFQTRYHGRVPVLTLVLPAAWAASDRVARAEHMFVDYPAGSWRFWITGDCCFVQARTK